jgi:hypothetical protein
MMKVATVVAKTTLSKVAPVAKVVGKAGLSTAIKLPLSLAKLTSSMLPMLGSVVLGGLYLLVKSMK